jgi:hypothetical protein
LGTSLAKVAVLAAAPSSCATTNPGTSTGRIPANVTLAARASVTVGFANERRDLVRRKRGFHRGPVELVAVIVHAKDEPCVAQSEVRAKRVLLISSVITRANEPRV